MSEMSPDTYAAVANELGLKGFRLSNPRTHSVEFSDPSGLVIYLQRTQKICLVANPESISVPVSIDDVDGYETWNSNFSQFARKDRTGKKPEKYGIGFDLESSEEVGEFIDELRKVL